MVKNWLIYLGGLAATLVFYANYTGWYAWFLLVLMVGLPVYSLLVSILAMVRVRIQLEVPAYCRRGEPAYVTIRARGSFLPIPKCRFRLRVTGRMTGETRTIKQQIPGQESWYVPLRTDHCGTLECSVEKVRVYDYLSLFWLPLPKGKPVELQVRPLEVPPKQLPNLTHFMARRRKPKPGGGFSEEHELRDYRPGDSMRDIHWKLSVKTDRLLVREAQEPVREQTLLTFDLLGTPDQVDSTLEQVQWLSRWLMNHDTVHQICWIDPTNCEIRSVTIQSEENLEQMMSQVLHAILQTDTPSVAERQFARATWRYHVRPQQEVTP